GAVTCPGACAARHLGGDRRAGLRGDRYGRRVPGWTGGRRDPRTESLGARGPAGGGGRRGRVPGISGGGVRGRGDPRSQRRLVSSNLTNDPEGRHEPMSETEEHNALASRECIPCKGGVPPLEGEELEALSAALGGDWTVVEGHHLEKEYRFDN